MVRRWSKRAGLLAALSLLLAPAAQAQADWSGAGGGLFVDEARETASEPTPRVQTALRGPHTVAGLPALAQPFGPDVEAAALAQNLDPKLLHALVLVESAYRPLACSRAGACGLTQLMPATALELGVVDRFDPAENLTGGAEYLVRQLKRFGDLRLALAAYNAGPARVARLGRVPAIAETENYVALVIDCYLALAAGRSLRSSRDCEAPQ